MTDMEVQAPWPSSDPYVMRQLQLGIEQALYQAEVDGLVKTAGRIEVAGRIKTEVVATLEANRE